MRFVLNGFAAGLLMVALSASANASPQSDRQAGPETKVPRLTVLYDAFGKSNEMTKDWGYAALIEVGDRRIIFDTGNDPGDLRQERQNKRRGPYDH